jgi:acyl-coenzyme A synthetase/AMP-(fatty) acid ligase
VVVPQEGVSGDDELRSTLAAYCRENLAGFKVPRSIDFVDELPRTGTGKIQKAKIREPYWEGRDRKI